MVLVLLLTAVALLASSVIFINRAGFRKYDCEVGNFLYAGFNQGPRLDDQGLVDISHLAPGQMRILRPTAAVGGCAFGDDYSFMVRRGQGDSLNKVVVEFQGGGACWNEETCTRSDNTDFTDTTLLEATVPFLRFSAFDCNVWNSWGIMHSTLFGGLIDREEKGNPVSGWSYVFVSYCTKVSS